MTWKHFIYSTPSHKELVLIETSLSVQIPLKELSMLSEVAIHHKKPDSGAFWNPEDTEKLDQIEDKLIELLGEYSHGWAVYILRVAIPGIRQYYIYHSRGIEFSVCFDEIRSLYPFFHFEYKMEEDPSWDQYLKYYRLFQNSKENSN